MLAGLEHSHLFVVPLDEERRWYRYEHLFADLLQHQMQKEYGTEAVCELHRRASRWYQDNHFIDDAISHALAARDWERAAGIIDSIGQERAHRGEWATLRDWLRALPEDVLRSHRRLCIWYCTAFAVSGPLDEAESAIQRIEAMVRGDPSAEGQVAAAQALFLNTQGDTPRTMESAMKALSLLPEHETDARCRTAYVLGYNYWRRGQFAEARPLLVEAHRVGRQSGILGVAATSLRLLSDMDRYGGRLRQAAEKVQQAIEMAGESPAAGTSHQAWGALLGEWNRLEEAVYHMQKAIELGQVASSQEFVGRAFFLLAYLKLVQGDEAGSVAALRKSCSIAHKLDSPTTQADHAAYHIMLALMQDDLPAASEWGRRLARNVDVVPFYINLIPFRLLIAQGMKAEAAERLKELYEETVRGGRQSYTIRIRVYQALAADNEESALGFLADALTMAEPEGYIRTFVDEGKLLAPLLKKAVSKGITPDYATRLLDIFQTEQRRNLASYKTTALSARETEVLRLLAEGLANQEICDRLSVSANTAKTHIRHVLEKLDSKGRLQAVARARQMKLI
jgi:LuxR family maltose regulon positive regulatory protein